MLYKIDIVNSRSGNKVTFLTSPAWKKEYGNTCKYQDIEIARENKTYKLMFTNEKGFYGIPTNTLVRQQGIRQNGTDFLSQSYTDRQLLFTARLFKDLMNDIDITMQQNQYSLLMIVYNEYDEYVSIDVDCLGNYESGNFEFKSVGSPFWESAESTIQDFEINTGIARKFFFPFKVNSEYFTSGIPRDTFTINTDYAVLPIWKIYKTWQNLTMTNVTTQEVFKLNVTCTNVVTIDSKNQDIYVDNRKVDESEYSGTFPELVGGENIYKFEFESAIYPINASVQFQNKRGSIL